VGDYDMSTGAMATHRRTRFALAAALGVVLLIVLLVDSTGPGGGGSGVAATQTVVLAGSSNVVVRVGGRQSVVVHADSNLLGRVTTRVRAGRLVIATTPGDLSAKTPMYVVVGVPSLHALSLQGAGNVSASGINTRRLTASLPGSGNLEASGTAGRLDVTLSGAGNALLRGLTARDAKARLGGSGSIMLTATHSLDATVSGTGTILYGGDPPHATTRVTGTGTISAG
jgi:putative autotransporter adhesin-like protein